MDLESQVFYKVCHELEMGIDLGAKDWVKNEEKKSSGQDEILVKIDYTKNF